MSKLPLFKPQLTLKEKLKSSHPWERSIKDKYAHEIRHSHNSIHIPRYPANSAKEKLPGKLIKFTVIGNRCSKEYIYCVRLVQGIAKYRSKVFDPPVIRGVTLVELPQVLKEIKLKNRGVAHCLLSQVAVLIDDFVLGGETELKELIESKYIYYLCLDYYKEAVLEFARFVNLAGVRKDVGPLDPTLPHKTPCVYMHISVEDEVIGTMIFTLFSDIVPKTCENFLRLCKSTKNGYAGTPIHRIVKDGWIQCGGYSLTSSSLNCENFDVAHDKRGVIAMANDGRDVDCSTQFFVLLQPAPWMANKYVAFGQLVDGANVLERLEKEPTFYEAPVNSINIAKSGILNLDCHDIIINKHTQFYINKHIDDLVAVGVMFYELLLEHAFLEIQFSELEKYSQQEGEEESRKEESLPKTVVDGPKGVMRKKRVRSSVGDYNSILKSIENVNQDFDVEDYDPEDYSYKMTSVPTTESFSVKPTKPFYLPLTDVPFPDENDSTYDLKKFLRGDYCHERDLEEVIMRTKIELGSNESFLSAEIEFDNDVQEYFSGDEDEELEYYMKMNADRVSFAGNIVRHIGRGQGMLNLLEHIRKSELITFNDEDVRKLRNMTVAVPDSERRFSRNLNVMRKQSQSGSLREEMKEEEVVQEENEISEVRVQYPDRRKISFPAKGYKGETNPEDLAKIGVFERGVTGGSSEDDDDEGNERKVRIAKSTKISTQAKLDRRATGFVRREDIPTDDDDEIMAQVQKYHEQTLGIGLGDGKDWFHGTQKVAPAPTLKAYQPLSSVPAASNLLLRGYRITKKEEPIIPQNFSYLRPSLTIDNSEEANQAINIYLEKKQKDDTSYS